MKKNVIALLIMTSMISTPVIALAEDDYEYIEPELQTYTEYPLPNAQQNTNPANNVSQQGQGYQSQYTVPVNSYQPQGYNNTNQNQLAGNVIYVPANTVFPAISTTMLSSETANAGDGVSFYLGSDFYYNGKLVAAAGSRVNGTIIEVKRGGMANRNGRIAIRFSHIVTPTGQIIPITASIQTDDGTGVLKGGTGKDVAKEYIKDSLIGAAAGAALGTAMGALSGGKVGRGAIYGTALGGGMGVLTSLMERGNDIDIPQNVQKNIVLDQPITVTSNTPY